MTPSAVTTEIPPQQVREQIRSRLLRVEGDRVLSVILHGSRAKGTARPRSDWDVVVVLRGPVDDWVEESLRLSALFYECPFSVDLQVFDQAEFAADQDTPGTLPFTIARHGECLYEQPVRTPARHRPCMG